MLVRREMTLFADYEVVFCNVARWLDGTALRCFGDACSEAVTSVRRLKNDVAFWKQYFERITGQRFSGHQLAGRTSWYWKARTFEITGARGLIVSCELLDVKLDTLSLASRSVPRWPLKSSPTHWRVSRKM